MSEGFQMKDFLVKNKRAIFSILVIIISVIAISFITALILFAADIIKLDDGIHFNEQIFIKFKDSVYGWLIFILLQAVLTILLCAIPGISMAFIILSGVLYPNPWEAFLLSFSSVLISSLGMYIFGRLGGHMLCEKILGKEDCEKALGLLRDKGSIYFPLMMLFPIFPDDALVMIAGTIRMTLKWFIPSILIGRGIGIATIVFGFSIIPFDKFTTPLHWIVFILICAVLILLVFFFANKFNNYIEKRKKSDK